VHHGLLSGEDPVHDHRRTRVGLLRRRWLVGDQFGLHDHEHRIDGLHLVGDGGY